MLTLLVCTVFVPAVSQAVQSDKFNGRWMLRLENDQRILNLPVDLRIEASESAKLVILGPANGEEGLFTGSLTDNGLSLSGVFDTFDASLNLSPAGDEMTGSLGCNRYKYQLKATRVFLSKPEVRVRDYWKVFEGVWKGVENSFYDPYLSGIDWAGARQKYLPMVRAARNDGELVVSLRRLLRELKNSNADINLSAGTPATELKGSRIEWKNLESDTGYLALRAFTPDDLYSFDSTLDKAMDEMGSNKAIIIDVRGNRGENLEAALAALNIILPEGRSIAWFITREGYSNLGVTSIDQVDPGKLPAAYIDNPAALNQFKGAGMYLAGGKYKRPYKGRFVLLIDEFCSGSCELFAAAMQESGVAGLVGRRTRGALSVTTSVTFTFVQWFRLMKNDVQGWQMSLPMMDIRTASGKKIEGTGVEPDLKVLWSADEDADLKRAIEWIKEEPPRN